MLVFFSNEEYERYLKFYQQTIRKNIDKWGNVVKFVCVIVLATEVGLLSELDENEVFILEFFRFINNCKNFSNKKKNLRNITDFRQIPTGQNAYKSTA